jgi:hypothetical protein
MGEFWKTLEMNHFDRLYGELQLNTPCLCCENPPLIDTAWKLEVEAALRQARELRVE